MVYGRLQSPQALNVRNLLLNIERDRETYEQIEQELLAVAITMERFEMPSHFQLSSSLFVVARVSNFKSVESRLAVSCSDSTINFLTSVSASSFLLPVAPFTRSRSV